MDNLNCVNIIHKGISEVTGAWVKGDLLREYDANGKLHFFVHQAWSPAVTTKHEIDPNTICRWTGFTNFKKEDIWEYDILEYVGPAKSDNKLRGLVFMRNGQWVCRIGDQEPMELAECMEDMVRIGSYFDKEHTIGPTDLPKEKSQADDGKREPGSSLLDMISRKTVLAALEVFSDAEHGHSQFLEGVQAARNLVKKMPAFIPRKILLGDLAVFCTNCRCYGVPIDRLDPDSKIRNVDAHFLNGIMAVHEIVEELPAATEEEMEGEDE